MFKEYFKAVHGWERFWFMFTWAVVVLNAVNCVVSITEEKYNEAFLYALVALLFVIIEFFNVLLWKSRVIIDELVYICHKQNDLYKSVTGDEV